MPLYVLAPLTNVSTTGAPSVSAGKSSSTSSLAEIVLDNKPVTIGRNPDNTVALQDTALSRYHCVIEPHHETSGYRIRDLESRNGTKVNGIRITDHILAPGDVVKLGSIEYIVETEQTLKERQAEARASRSSNGEATSTAKPGWAIDLEELVNMLPPKGAAERVKLIDAAGKPSAALSTAGEGPLATRLLLCGASKARATDLHLEPKGDVVNVRMRIDGQMVQVADLPNRVGTLVYGLIKTACQFRTTARDAVLDGHFSCAFKAPSTSKLASPELDDDAPAQGPHAPARRVDYRVSFTPSVHGQKLVLRILDSREAPKNLSELDLPPYMLERIKGFCKQDSGMLLVCGPTGSGKTTTLYNALREIDRERKNVVTIEDPVEYQLDNVTQIPVDEESDNTFGALLRSVLRQDPDVILVGEIRDEETARTAMQASMTGHLVFSTVHAKDTISSVFRILDLKVEPYLVANSVELIVAQRLVRVLCETCKRPVPITPGQATRMGRYLEGKSTAFVATGCAACLRTGYRGRRGIFETLDFTEELRDVILSEPTISAMRKVIETGLFTTLTQSGWQLVARGYTTLEEVDRVATAR